LLGIKHVGVIHRPRAIRGLASQIGDRLVDGHVGADADVAGVHEPAGVILRIREQPVHFLPRRIVEERQDLLSLLGRNLLDQICGVIRSEKPDPGAALGLGKHEQEVCLITRAQAQEEILGLGPRQRLKAFQAVLGDEQVPRFEQVLSCEALGDIGLGIGRRHWIPLIRSGIASLLRRAGAHRSGSVGQPATAPRVHQDLGGNKTEVPRV